MSIGMELLGNPIGFDIQFRFLVVPPPRRGVNRYPRRNSRKDLILPEPGREPPMAMEIPWGMPWWIIRGSIDWMLWMI